MKILIKIAIILLVLLSGTFGVSAQNKKVKQDDLGRIAIAPYIPSNSKIPSSARKMLLNRMSRLVTSSGMASAAFYPRFIVMPEITVLSKDITPTAPPMIAMNLEITLYVGDGIEGIKFASTTIEAKGVGKNDTKAYLMALKRLNPKSVAMKAFLEEGKAKIIEYYNTRCDFIKKEAKVLEDHKEFDAALLKLTSVPEVCKECYEECMDIAGGLYQKKVDKESLDKLEAAKRVWDTGQDWDAAKKAGSILVSIPAEAACFSQVTSLSQKIAKRIKAMDQREWDYVLKAQAQESERIEAVRAIGVAYGENQPKEVNYNVTGW